jgi:hypothetical protein
MPKGGGAIDGAVGRFTASQDGRTQVRIASGITEIFRVTKPFCPLTGMNTKGFIWGKGKSGRCVRLTTLPTSCADCLWKSRDHEPPGAVGVNLGLDRDSFTLTLQCEIFSYYKTSPHSKGVNRYPLHCWYILQILPLVFYSESATWCHKFLTSLLLLCGSYWRGSDINRCVCVWGAMSLTDEDSFDLDCDYHYLFLN